MDRRAFLRGLALTPLAAALSSALSGCGRSGNWPEGMAEFKWDRDTCARCSMVISDRRFAVQIRGGDKNTAFKFDDIGCAVIWLQNKQQDYPWMTAAATRFWVADVTGQGDKWLDARKAHYSGGRVSPMAYNQSATAYPEAGAMGFEEMRQHVLAKGK